MGWICDKTCIQTRVFKWRGETNQSKNGIDLVIPVVGAVSKPIEHPFKEPIFIGSSFGITTRRADNSNVVGGENTLAECILQSPWHNGWRDTTAKLVKKRRESWQRTGANLLLVLQTLSSWLPRTTMWDLAQKRAESLILLDDKDAHSWNCPRCPFFT